jgi:type VI secretion system secreted protein VgrG
MAAIELWFESGESSLAVHRFSVEEALSRPFSVQVTARSPDPSLDLDAIIGQRASLRIASGYRHARVRERVWSGVCDHIDQERAEPAGLSTYSLRIVPSLRLLTQRRNHRIFQRLSIPDIVGSLLGEWGIGPIWRIDRQAYPKLDFKVQYGESDHAFVARLLEEAGIAFTFSHEAGDEAPPALLLADALHEGDPRSERLPFVAEPDRASEREYVTGVRLGHEVRPGAHAIRDFDFRRASFPLLAEAKKAKTPEDRYEQYHYRPGAFLVDDGGEDAHDLDFGKDRADRALLADRAGKRAIAYETNAIDLSPGSVFSITGHPHPELDEAKKLLVTALSIQGSPDGEWTMKGRAVFADEPYRPPAETPRPVIRSVQSAIVVGPGEQEIHTDEHGRVRVQFPWDREGGFDEESSCWIRVSQGWGGAAFGLSTLPRVGQEVLVAFLDGDPDQPVIVGRLFNALNPVPYDLPKDKTISAWKSDSSPGSAGYNEILFEDRKGEELVRVQAEKSLRALVKNDETITIGHDREKRVGGSEVETAGEDRAQVTGKDRIETIETIRTTFVGGDRGERVKGKEAERIEGRVRIRVGKGLHTRVEGTRRKWAQGDGHLLVKGSSSEEAGKTRSLRAQGLEVEIEGSCGLEAGEEIHCHADTKAVAEGEDGLTFKGAGGFVRIDSVGVTIKGQLVKINAGGSAGSGSGVSAEEPEDPEEANVEEPAPPPPPPEPKKEPPKRRPVVEKTWIRVRIVDADGRTPVPGTAYQIRLPNGAIKRGRVDESGEVTFHGIDPGECELTLPELDGDAWERNG